ncbi:MAG: acyltransferase family protein [Lachnospiraceae bacterium]|nr:acyltransferase family protein [Lachnospiraceae bacterium]
MKSQRKVFLDLIRIFAILGVIYNHSTAWELYQVPGNIHESFGYALTCLARIAVPLFFMVSGVTLLEKEESIKILYRKRVSRMVLCTVLISIAYYLWALIRKEIELISPLLFAKETIAGPYIIPLWFLYAYIGFLMILPVLRLIAKNMTAEIWHYLFLFALIEYLIRSMLCVATGLQISSYISLTNIVTMPILYSLLGYCLYRFEKEKMQKIGVIGFAIIAVVYLLLDIASYIFSASRILSSAGELRSIVLGVAVFGMFYCIGERVKSERVEKTLTFVGDRVFGVYLLDSFVSCNGKLAVIKTVSEPVLGPVIPWLIIIVVNFVIKLALTSVLKLVPGIKKLV